MRWPDFGLALHHYLGWYSVKSPRDTEKRWLGLLQKSVKDPLTLAIQRPRLVTVCIIYGEASLLLIITIPLEFSLSSEFKDRHSSRMHFTGLLSFASALAYMPLILATASTTTYELCTTKYGTKSVAQPGSTTYALRTTVFETQVRTTTPVKTITPVGKTITVYQPAVAFTTVTKSPQKTATFSTTSTIVTTVSSPR